MAAGMLGGSGLGQTPLPRDVAAFSVDDPGTPADESGRSMFESTIAAGDAAVMAVYHSAPAAGLFEIGYALATVDSNGVWTWTEGVINPGQFANDPNDPVGLTDPSVAYDLVTGDFLVCAMTRDLTRIVVARYDAQANPSAFNPWEVVLQSSGIDKTWIVAGEVFKMVPPPGFAGPIPEIRLQEFYITSDGAAGLKYLRSMDGGQNWIGGDALTDLNNSNSGISPVTVPAPRVYNKRPLYVAFVKDLFHVEFLRGDDVNSGVHAGEVQFTHLIDDGNGQNLSVDFNWSRLAQILPVPPESITIGARGPGFDLSPDPTDANRLFFVYHDTPTADPNDARFLDLNIYLRVLTRVSGARWSIDPPLNQLGILVADDSDPLVETDQFLPSMDVDANGEIHIVYYDDQDFSQNDSDFCPTACPRFDVVDAVSDTGGASWQYFELCDDPQNGCASTEPAVDFRDLEGQEPGSQFALRDYIGIDVRNARVWTSFMGTSDERDTNPDKSVIWSTQITLP